MALGAAGNPVQPESRSMRTRSCQIDFMMQRSIEPDRGIESILVDRDDARSQPHRITLRVFEER